MTQPRTPHPRADALPNPLNQPAQSAAQLGYRMPGEFEPVDAVYLTTPRDRETWPGCFEQARRQHANYAEQVAKLVDLQLIDDDHPWNPGDSWFRDYGPIFVLNKDNQLAAHDFHFDGWGGKYGRYPEDDVIPQRIASQLNIPIWVHDLTLEGGSIESNGKGTILTTEQCLLNPNRNPHLTRQQIEQQLHEALGSTHVIWLPGGIEGDDTDGHIDDVARFISPTEIAAVRAPADHPDHHTLEQNWQALEAARDQNGEPLKLHALPAPPPLIYDYPKTSFRGKPHITPASYANFLILNDHILMPAFDTHTDQPALQALQNAMPNHKIIPIPANRLVVGLGTLHCLSMQRPCSAIVGL